MSPSVALEREGPGLCAGVPCQVLGFRARPLEPRSPHFLAGWEQRVSARAPAAAAQPRAPPNSLPAFSDFPLRGSSSSLSHQPLPYPSRLRGFVSWKPTSQPNRARSFGALPSGTICVAGLGKGRASESPASGKVETTSGLSCAPSPLCTAPVEAGGGRPRVRGRDGESGQNSAKNPNHPGSTTR